MGNPELEAKLEAYIGIETGPPEFGGDLVNEAMIHHWCDAMGDRNPIYSDPAAARQSRHGGIVAPPAMLQAWVLPGARVASPATAPQDKQRELHRIFDSYGYTGVVATNCDQEYTRYLRPGDKITGRSVIDTISDEKATGLGIGYFIETSTTFSDERGAEVGKMVFRVLKFRPGQPKAAQPAADPAAGAAAPKPGRIRAPRAHDNGWWWDAIDRGEILIQKCSACGALRHPPRPRCFRCQSDRWEGTPSRGVGTINSYVVMHHPPIPGYDFPLPVGLIDLEEGVRIVSNLVGFGPGEIRIGAAVEAHVEEVEQGLKLPVFRPAK